MLNHFQPGQVITGHLVIGEDRFPFEAQVRWSAGNARFGALFLNIDERYREFTRDITPPQPKHWA